MTAGNDPTDPVDAGEAWLLEGLQAERDEERAAQRPADAQRLERDDRVAVIWDQWKAQQMARCRTMRFRRMVVEYLNEKITEDATEVPREVRDHLDTILALDEMEPPDSAPELHPAFAERCYSELLAEVRRRKWHRGSRP